MRLVVDANVLFSALIKNSATRKLFKNQTLELFAPAFLLVELAKYSTELQNKAKLTEEKFSRATKKLTNLIAFIPDNELEIFLGAANQLVTDKKDALYVACALAINAEIWSNDTHLQNPRVRVWTTGELIESLYQ